MKIGIVTGLWWIAESASLVASLKRAAALGFRYVDIQGTLHGSPRQLGAAERQAVKRELAALGLVLRNYILHASHDPASASEGELEHCYRYLCEGIDMAALADVGHMALAREGPDDLTRLGDAIIHAHLSDHESSRHTNQVLGMGITRVSDYIEAFWALDIDRRMRRFGYDELVVSLELGAPGDRIADADDWARRSLHYLRQVAPHIAQT